MTTVLSIDGRRAAALSVGGSGPKVSGQALLNIGGELVQVTLEVPDGPVSLEDLLPIFQGLTDIHVTLAVEKAQAAGHQLSCKAGCGACCRQLVPVSNAEARGLARLVEAMPEPRRTAVRERFEAAAAAMDFNGLTGRLNKIRGEAKVDLQVLGMDYFRLGLDCPFLEEESCSIHPDRPLACREYLVTSPASNCDRPSAETIEMVELAAKPSLALVKADAEASGDGWAPLALALRFARNTPDSAPRRAAPELLQEVIGQAREP